MNISRRNLIQMALLATGAAALPAIASPDTIDTLPKAYAISGGTKSGKTRALDAIAWAWVEKDPQNRVVILDLEGPLVNQVWSRPIRRPDLVEHITGMFPANVWLHNPSPKPGKDKERTLVLIDMPELSHSDTREGATRHLCKTFAQQTGLNVIYTIQNPGQGLSITLEDGKVVDNPYSGTPIAQLIRTAIG